MRTTYLKYIAALLLFGSNGIVAAAILLGSSQIVFTRTLIGSVFLLMLWFAGRRRLQALGNLRHFAALVLSGAAMGGSWMFLYEAYKLVGVSVASLEYYCGPVIVMAVSPFLFGERFTLPKVAGFAAVLAGLGLLNGGALLQGGWNWGLLYGGLSALTYAVMVIFNKKAKSIGGLENATLQLLVSFLTVALTLALRGGLGFSVPAGSWLPILLLGVVNTGLGCYFYFSSIGELPVQSVVLLGYAVVLGLAVGRAFGRLASAGRLADLGRGGLRRVVWQRQGW